MAGPQMSAPGEAVAAATQAQGTEESKRADFATEDGHRKAFLTLQARAALLGFELIELGCNTYLLARWGVSRELPDLRAVGDLLRRIGGGKQ